MNANCEYPVLRHHPELRPVVDDLVWLAETIERAGESVRTSAALCLSLAALREGVIAAFWSALYKVSRISGRQKLELRLGGAEPVVVAREEVNKTAPARSRISGLSGGFPFSLS